MICTVGLNCVDIVSFVSKFPVEDSDQRCLKQIWARGGNASNNATVLALLGAKVEFFGTLANDPFINFVKDDMNTRGIVYDNCPILNCTSGPSSVVLCSQETGSRTIVHNNGDLPQLTVRDFDEKIELYKYNWIHFEGRNVEETLKMLEKIKLYNLKHADRPNSTEINYKKKKLPLSIEIEKCRDSLTPLLDKGDVMFIGKDYSSFKGAQNAEDAVRLFVNKVPIGTVIICPWGDQGAAYGIAESSGVKVTKVKAFPQHNIVDSLGAGDTFIATVIYCLHKGLEIDNSVRIGCKVASAKLGTIGFDGIKTVAIDIDELKT